MDETVTDPRALFEEVDFDHPLTDRRIPVVRHPYVRWSYHVALQVGDGGWGPAGQEPTEREADQLVAYLDYRLRWYNDSYRARMLDKYPFDVDGGVNTYTLRKTEGRGWQYNARSWEIGPAFVGSPDGTSLVDLLEHINRHGSGWAEFKAENPDLWEPAA